MSDSKADARQDRAMLITYPDYPVNTDTFYGYTAAVGHAGVLLIRAEGFTKYYEFGRYDPAKHGQVRNTQIKDAVIGKQGEPTAASLKTILAALSNCCGKGTRIRAAYFLHMAFDEMLKQAMAEQPQYDILAFNCGHYAEAVILKGNPHIDRPRLLDPTPNNIVDEYIEEGNAEVLYLPGTDTITIGEGNEADAKQ